MFRVALDAGHGMNTAGKRCLKSLDANETREWHLNNRICNLIAKKLEAYEGYELMRVDDTTGKTDISLSKRTQSANNWGADFYISVHHDAGVNGGKGGGITAIIYTYASEESKQYQKIIYDEMIKTTGLKGNRAEPMPKQNLHVCRETKMPAVLVECGFMDSATDVPIILTEEFANESADGLVSALVKIGNLKAKSSNFADIKGHYAEASINELLSMGIVKGNGNGNFKPDEALKRGDAAIMIRNAIKYITGK